MTIVAAPIASPGDASTIHSTGDMWMAFLTLTFSGPPNGIAENLMKLASAAPLQRLVSRPTLGTRLSAGQDDLPIPEGRDQFEFTAQRRYVPTKCRDEAVFEILASLEA